MWRRRHFSEWSATNLWLQDGNTGRVICYLLHRVVGRLEGGGSLPIWSGDRQVQAASGETAGKPL